MSASNLVCACVALPDLSQPIVDEKAELPAIIVTPSTPTGDYDFHIAFLAPPPKPSLRERVSAAFPKLSNVRRLFHRRLPSEIQLPTSPTPFKHEFDAPSSWSFTARARVVVLLAVLVFIMGCHLIMHSMVSAHPRLDFAPPSEDDLAVASLANVKFTDFGNAPHNSPHNVADSSTPTVGGWFNLHAMWAPMPITDGKRAMRFIVTDEETEEPQA